MDVKVNEKTNSFHKHYFVDYLFGKKLNFLAKQQPHILSFWKILLNVY